MKIMRRVLSLLLFIFLTLTLTACGKKIEGEWKLTGGNAVTAIYSLDGTIEGTDAEVIFRFEKDSVLSMEMTRSGISESLLCTWEADGDTLSLIIDGQPIKTTYAINGDEMTIFFTYQGQNASFVLKRI